MRCHMINQFIPLVLSLIEKMNIFPLFASVTIQTPQTAPVTAPRDVSGGGGKVGTLTISWDVSINFV